MALEIKYFSPILLPISSSTFGILLYTTLQHIIYTFKYLPFLREMAAFNNCHSIFYNFQKCLVKPSISIYPRYLQFFQSSPLIQIKGKRDPKATYSQQVFNLSYYLLPSTEHSQPSIQKKTEDQLILTVYMAKLKCWYMKHLHFVLFMLLLQSQMVFDLLTKQESLSDTVTNDRNLQK